MNQPQTDLDDEFAPPSSAAGPKPPRSRFRRLRKVALWVLGICAAIVLVLSLGSLQVGRMGQRQLNVTTGRLDANDPGWKLDAILDERKKQEPPAAENAAPIVLDIADRVPEEWRKWYQSEEAKPFWVTNCDNHLPPADAIAAARKQAAGTLLARTDAVRLRDKRGGIYPLTIADDPIATLLPHLDKARRVGSLLQYDAHLAVLDKNPTRGINAARAVLGVARSIGDEPLLISQLVRMACANVAAQTAIQVLAWSEPSEGLAEIQADLLTEAEVPWFRIGMRGERAMLDKVFRGFEDGSIPPEHWFAYMEIKNPGPEAYAAFRAYRPLIPGDHAKTLEITTAYVEAANLPHHEQIAALKAIPIPKGPPDEFRYILTRLLVPACEKVAEAGLRCRATLLTAATCVACERFRLKHKRWPRELAELTPAFLPSVPVNPFDGKPITYRVLGDRIAVYCYWANSPLRLDDQPPEFRDPKLPGIGIGFRVWNPDQRALQPLEKNAP